MNSYLEAKPSKSVHFPVKSFFWKLSRTNRYDSTSHQISIPKSSQTNWHTSVYTPYGSQAGQTDVLPRNFHVRTKQSKPVRSHKIIFESQAANSCTLSIQTLFEKSSWANRSTST